MALSTLRPASGTTLTSVVSYPERDPVGKVYGDPGYWGNCSGLLVRDILTHYLGNRPNVVVADPMSGSGTVADVCDDLGLTCDAYDLQPKPRRGIGSWDARTDELGRAADAIWIHDPYWNIVPYSTHVWKERRPDPRDLSLIPEWDAFLKAMNEVHLRLFSDLKAGGLMFVLCGDIRRQGRYYSMARELAWFGEPEAVVIKTQHNVRSDQKRYAGRLLPIMHETLLVWRRNAGSLIGLIKSLRVEYDLMQWEKVTWKALVRGALEKLGRKATLSSLYSALEQSPKARKNTHWRERIRATLQESPDFHPEGAGVWRLAA